MASKLQIILADVVKNPSELHDRIVVVHEANYEKISKDFTDSFLTPSGGFNKMIYTMYCFPYLSAVIVQKNANCTSAWRQSTSLAGSFKCGELIEFKKETVPAKTWNYPFSYLGNPNPQYCSSVSMLLLPSKSKNSFTIKGWLSDYVINIPQNVLIIYVEIIDSAERKFKVKAHISGPGFKSPVAVDLLDNGNGDPDVKAGDGIYSRYFTSLSQKGSYTVSVSAELQTAADGSFFVEGNAEQISNPQQKKIIGIFYVNGPLPEIDILPPNRIADLTVISVNHEDRTAILQWTAPGDNYDSGTAKEYEIYITEDWKDLQDSMLSKIHTNTLESNDVKLPKPSGQTEKSTFQFPIQSKSAVYYIAMRAADDFGNKGLLSNTIQVVIGVETNSTSNITGLNITGNGTETSTESIQKIVSDTDDFIKCYPILAGSLGVLLIIIIINILVWTVCFRKYKKRWEKSQNEIKEEEINVKTNTEFKQSILEKSVNPHSYTNPVMAEYSNSSDTYGIIQTPTTPNLPATYALVVKKK